MRNWHCQMGGAIAHGRCRGDHARGIGDGREKVPSRAGSDAHSERRLRVAPAPGGNDEYVLHSGQQRQLHLSSVNANRSFFRSVTFSFSVFTSLCLLLCVYFLGCTSCGGRAHRVRRGGARSAGGGCIRCGGRESRRTPEWYRPDTRSAIPTSPRARGASRGPGTRCRAPYRLP
jgi:hypothetical protein